MNTTDLIDAWRLADGTLHVQVDCYTASGRPDPVTLDEELRWEAEMLHLSASPDRAGWRDAWRLARAFLRGRKIVTADAPEPFDMGDWLARVRGV